MKSFFIILFILVSIILVQQAHSETSKENLSKKPKLETKDTFKTSNKEFEAKISKHFKVEKEWKKINSTSAFETWIKVNDYQVVNGKKIWNKAIFKIDSAKNYDKIKSDKKTVVIYPTFTDSAYSEPGFYTYYRGECNEKCLTIKIQNNFLPQANPNAVQVLKLLGYSFVTDIDVDKNPSILSKYNKVIILHNEYVTKKEFDAITSHPNVIYLYPNALYAEVKPDYAKNTITLVRGHSYPEKRISNGFDWKFDNSNLEYDTDCKNMQFYKINNGWMLNCYPENIIHKSMKFLEIIKKL
ncbi:hypothetical protein [Candidatus Nitrosotenuis aquarius]|uniref:hypothetical protein n=1 Tax=Candidatus Nitrosotenuis aquarius TaxID=1846278 RepID=UPI000C1E2856|nr:hypothetical protein [Candidatus Nitrosotenuis aquarius]